MSGLVVCRGGFAENVVIGSLVSHFSPPAQQKLLAYNHPQVQLSGLFRVTKRYDSELINSPIFIDLSKVR